MFPSHPLLPEGVQVIGVDISEDPKGLTYIPVLVGQERDGDTGNMIENLFPGLSVWDCELPGPPVGLVNSSSGGNESAVGVSGSPVVANGPPIGATGSPVSPDEVSGPKAVPEIPRPGGPGVLQRALLLTTTSTSTELDDEPIPTKASGLRMQPTVAQSDKTAAEMLAHPTETPLCCNMNMAM